MVGGGGDLLEVAGQVHARGQIGGAVAVILAVVDVRGDHRGTVAGRIQHIALPRAEGGHVTEGGTAGHELKTRICAVQRGGGLCSQSTVVRSAAVPDLPGPVHLIAQAPQAHIPRLGPTVGCTLICQGGALLAVHVLEEIRSLGHAARAEVHGEHRLGACRVGPVHELVQAHGVRLGGMPGKVTPHRSLIDRADTVLPAVTGDEVPSGIAHEGHAQLADEIQHVAPEAVLIGRRVSGFVDARVDAAAHVLDEGPEQATAGRTHGERGV